MRRVLLLAALALCLPASAQVSSQLEPGIEAPNGNTPFALQQTAGGRVLVPVHHAQVAANNHRGANVAGGLLAGPFYKAKMTTELAGEHARTQLSTTPVALYCVPIHDASSEEGGTMTVELLRTVPGKDRRTMQQVNFTALTGNAKKNNSGSLVETTSERLPSGWIKIVPKEPLEPGEYALVPVAKQANTFASVVWDFGIDPAAPADPDAKPVVESK